MTIKTTSRTSNGYTIVELLIVIIIIGILAAIGIVAFTSVQTQSRNSQRLARLTVISEALEKYYDQNGRYPACSSIASPVPVSTVSNDVLKGLDPDVLTAPSVAKGTNSLTCDSEPIDNTFAYIESSGLKYTLKYKNEGSVDMVSLKSRRQAPVFARTLTLIAGTNGTVSGGGVSFTSEDSPIITAIPNANYSFSNWTGDTGCSGLASHTIDLSDGNKTCTANFIATPITTPDPPTVTANTAGTDTTWSWSVPSTDCGSNTARYQYRYTISPSAYDSGLVETTLTSVPFTTTTEGQTYTVAVQAQCYNAATFSDWSTPIGSASYLRPITYKTLTIIAGANGTVNTGGSFATGSSQTITATPNSGYQFSSWTGDTGCSGVASHTITMDENKTCTANFTLLATYTLSLVAGTGGTVSQSGTSPYISGSTPTITATPNANYVFTSWTGDTGCSGVASHTITMNANKTCTANFTATYTLTLIAGIGGTVSQSGTSPYISGSTPTITATPNSGYIFSSWTGTSCSGTASHTITMSANRTCTANFTASYTLTLIASPSNYGSVSGSGTYSSGATATMTATPITYYTVIWTGSTGCDGVASHTITMNGNKTCTANFQAIPTPTTPVITATSDATYTTFSWANYDCGTYNPTYNPTHIDDRYTISPSGYDSGWLEQSAPYYNTPIFDPMYTTSTRYQTYTYQAKATCFDYNTQSFGPSSGIGTVSYYRP